MNGERMASPVPPRFPAPGYGWRHSVFWKVAGVLVGVQVAMVVLAVGLGAWLAYDRSLDLVANSLRLRLDSAAEELEQRTSLTEGLANLPETVRIDLAQRFPDPVFLLEADGASLLGLDPEGTPVADPVGEWPRLETILPVAVEAMQNDSLVVHLERPLAEASWGLAPVYDVNFERAGALLVYPLRQSVAAELVGTLGAYGEAIGWVSLLAGLTALLLGSLFTWRLVKPLRQITRRVEAIGQGEYAARLEVQSDDEFGRLARSINDMAAQVAQSVEALRATDRLRRDLMTNIGHDLRTPLTAVLGYMEEAERYLAEGKPGAAEKALDEARRQGAYLQNLVANWFELSVLDHVPPPLRREPIPLAELLHESARAHRSAFEEAGVSFTLDLPESLPTFTGDGVRLLRVLDNLLSNARRHTQEGGEVRLSARKTEEALEIRVADTGEGIAPEALAHVFERHFRGTHARTRTTRTGTGLGLAISRAIARAHGGELTAESVEGEGSTFVLYLPTGSQGKSGDQPADSMGGGG